MAAIDERETEILLDGRYRLGPCVGRGGMAAVYRAEDTFLGRTIAIKMLGPADDASAAGERVHNETTVLASLNHSSLVTLYDARLDPEHPRYLAIEYVDGPTLSARLAQGSFSEPEAAALASDLAEALHVVHDAGVIHRDVKPSNVLLARTSRRDTGWTAKLTDFGIAYSLTDPRVTSPGVVVGTAAYMAPEQVRGADLTPAVDIYSLGLVLIEALTGEPAFPVTGRVPTALRRLAEAPEIPDSVGPHWETLLTRMTRIAPEERPSVHEVAQAADFLSDAPSHQDRRTAVHPAPTALMPITTDVRTTGPTQKIASAGPPPLTRRPRGRKMRDRALGMMTVVAALMIAIAGSWALSPPSASPERVVSRMSADDVFAPTSPGSNPLPDSGPSTGTDPATSTSTDTESGTDSGTQPDTDADSGPEDAPGHGVTEGDPDTNPIDTNPIDTNPNKGPGNNSGDQKEQPRDDNSGK